MDYLILAEGEGSYLVDNYDFYFRTDQILIGESLDLSFAEKLMNKFKYDESFQMEVINENLPNRAFNFDPDVVKIVDKNTWLTIRQVEIRKNGSKEEPPQQTNQEKWKIYHLEFTKSLWG